MTHVCVFTLLGLIGWHAGEVYRTEVKPTQGQVERKAKPKRQLTDRPLAKLLLA